MHTHRTPFGSLRIYRNQIPAAFAAASPRAVLEALGGPTLVILDAAGHSRTRLASCLIHGNESSGFHAVCDAMRRMPSSPYANMIYLIGHVGAALDGPEPFAQRLIALTGVPETHWDMNRIWSPDAPTAILEFTAPIRDTLAPYRIEGAIDLHNTSAANPPFGVVASAVGGGAGLAARFVERAMVYEGGHSFIGAGDFAYPSFALECGKIGTPDADRVAAGALEVFRTTPTLNFPPKPCTYYRTAAEVKVGPGAGLHLLDREETERLRADPLRLRAFPEHTLCIPADVETSNFRSPNGVPRPIAYCRGTPPLRLSFGPQGELPFDRYFIHDPLTGGIAARDSCVVAMATGHLDNIRNSAFLYLITPIC